MLIIFCQWVSPVEIFTGWDDGGARLASGCSRLGRPTQPIFKRKYFQWSDIFCWCLWFVHSRIGKHSHGVFTLYLAFTDVEHQEHLMKLIDWSFSSPFACWSDCTPTHPPAPCLLTGASRRPAHDFKRSFMIFLRIPRFFWTFSCSFAFLGLVLSPPRVVGCRQVPPQSGTRPQTYDSVTPKPSSQWQRDLVSSNYKGGFQINTFQ